MTWSYRAASIALIFAVCSVPAAAQKVAFVRGNALLKAAPGIDQRQAMLEREAAYFQGEAQKMVDSLQKLEKAYRDAEPTLSPATRETRQKALQDQLQKFQKSRDSLQDVAARRQDELLQPIIEAVNRVLADFRTEGGYAYIYNLDESGAIVAFDRNLDVTDELISRVKRLTAPAPPKSIIPEPKKLPPGPGRGGQEPVGG